MICLMKLMNRGFFLLHGVKILFVLYIRVEAFRGISLINSTSKILTNILAIRLQTWAENNNVIVESQASFRKQYSTSDNIFSLQAFIQKYLCQAGGRSKRIFVDFRRAFDSLPYYKI